MLNKTNYCSGSSSNNCSTPKSAYSLSNKNTNFGKKSISNNIYISTISNESEHRKYYKQTKQHQPNKSKSPNANLQQQYSDQLASSIVNILRVKTEGDTSRDIKAELNPKMYHPDIYHKPKFRKQIFCKVIDSYMKNMGASNKERNFNRLKSLKSEHKQMDFKVQNQTIFESNTQQSFNSLANSKAIINISKKRAGTAGYQRKIQIQQNSNSNSNSKIYKNLNRRNQFSSDTQDEIYERKKFLVSKKKTTTKYNLKDKAKAKFVSMARNHIIQKNKHYNPQNQLSNSNSNSFDSRSEIQDFVQTQLVMKNQKGSFDQKCNSKYKSNQKQKLDISYDMRDGKKRKQLIFVQDSAQSSIAQQQHIMDQIKLKVKLLNKEYQMKQFSGSILHRDQLFTLFLLIQKPEEVYGSSLTKQRSMQKLKNSNKQKTSRMKVKQFKDNLQGRQMESALQKIKEYGVSHIWNPFPKTQMKIENCNTFYFSPVAKPLRQQLLKFRRQYKNEDSISYRIYQTKAYHQLFYNNCEYFRDIIVSVAKDLIKMRGGIINNKITLDNVYRLQQKSLKVGDWGCAAFKRKLTVAGKEVVFKDEPILKSQKQIQSLQQIPFNNQKIKYQWLLSPQCLPPQIIQCVISGCYSKIWQIQECPEIWSLGIMIFQILTGVPVWMPQLSGIGHKIPKKGIFFDQAKRLPVIYSYQIKMPNIVSRWIRDEKNSDFYKKIHPQILHLMKDMLQINTKLRPKPEDIIRKLSNADFINNI